ncbi:putative hydrolase of the HAD superfamily [Aquimarina amphilecti]|uniref:Putative hydrolase of the HAD superfamily n=1 Tax=Aquimarina amphilecti TaxID=1038014 RepID=A0A1H7VSL5_AQUAM|nr:HAD-IA family hydrolase [Aquimarina amphilecti]SEM11787.1 putative hydrolase of the HAD superfamily [Aquimarina amphilecti]
MIKTIIFDFGDVFINLDKHATEKELLKLGLPSITEDLEYINESYETGKITTIDFINYYQKLLPDVSEKKIIDAWNSILKDFPKHRLKFIQKLSENKTYLLILLSNTNELHIDWIKENVPFYNNFKSCFNFFYLSHEINLRKPNHDIFRFVLDNHQLNPVETLFIDDTFVNTNTAQELGINIWNNDPKKEDITNLFTIKSNLF